MRMTLHCGSDPRSAAHLGNALTMRISFDSIFTI
jgi:hypothetical protein